MELTVPIIWAVLGFLAILAVVLLYLGLFQDRSRGRPRCPRCWYHMTGAPSLVCPECGHDARNPKRLYRTRRRRWAIVLAVLMAACCYYSWLVRIRVVELEEPLAFALRPTVHVMATFRNAPMSQVNGLANRIKRFGLWPWEERLLLWVLEPYFTGSRPQVRASWSIALVPLSAAADKSERSFDRLFALHKDPDRTVVHAVLWELSRHARRLDDERLAAVLKTHEKNYTTRWSSTAEPILLEMIRRNRPAFREQAKRWAGNPPVDNTFKTKENLALLTALRRMEGKPGPVCVFVGGSQVIECTAAKQPPVDVRIRNADTDKEALGLRAGGDYRLGSRAHWRFEVCDERGNLMPVKPLEYDAGGVGSGFRMLEFGQSYETRLEMDEYIEPLAPGRYRVRVLYHDSRPIAGMEDFSGLIVFKSDPFELIVRPAGPHSRPGSAGQ
jgi:hypothetical protein